MKPITDREREVIRAFVLENAQDLLVHPLRALSDLLLTQFRWPMADGKKRAAIVISELVKEGLIECDRTKNGALRGLRVAARTSEPVQAIQEFIDVPPLAETIAKISPPRRTPPKRKKGVARRMRLAVERGGRNEGRFHFLVGKLLALLGEKFPENIIEASCSRSGVHNLRKGRVDVRDHQGEDVRVTMWIQWGGAAHEGDLIYDAKSSPRAAAAFNGNIRRYAGQEDALVKRAIVVNDGIPDADIVLEVLGDMVSSGLLPATLAEEIPHMFSAV